MSNKDIKSLSEVKNIPDSKLIDAIKVLLKEAESGDLRAIGYVKLWDDEQTTHGWCVTGRSEYSLSAMLGQSFQLMTELSTDINGVHESSIKGDE